MTLIVGMACALATVSSPAPGQTLYQIVWKERPSGSVPDGAEFLPGEAGQPDALRLTNPESTPRQFTLVAFEPPAIEAATYAVRGRLRYRDVDGDGYLEMWNHFPNGGAFFTKTLASAGGPLGVIRGTSDWREFALPFNKGAEASPSKLVINLVLPGRGVVEISDLELYAPASDLIADDAATFVWWPERMAGLMGGIGGSVLGLFLGCVIAPLIAAGRARHFVYIALGAVGGCGVIALAAGASALAVGQPYHVYYPALLLGGMGAVFGLGGFALALHRYRQHDLRRMSALDVG